MNVEEVEGIRGHEKKGKEREGGKSHHKEMVQVKIRILSHDRQQKQHSQINKVPEGR